LDYEKKSVINGFKKLLEIDEDKDVKLKEEKNVKELLKDK
jgi:hypothetical protein